MKKEVILVFPGKSSIRPQLPLSCLFLAKTLEKKGYTPKIIDMRLEDYNLLDLKIDDVICVGISTMTSPMILHGIEFAKQVRDVSPHTPIVWGGIHPSLLPNQTILNDYVDIVVRGEGELTLLELVQKLESEESLENVKGITYKENGTIKANPDREWMNLNEIGTLPYHLIDMNKYNITEFTYQSSRGCPYNCGFCYNRAFNKKSYRFKSSENVLKDLEYIVNKFNLKQINFDDDNFFVHRKRVEEICRGILERNFNIDWYATCRINYFAKYNSEFINLLKDSGCKKILFGAESGSTNILKSIDKDIEVEETISAVKKCKEAGIIPILSFMCGFSNETREDVDKTLDFIDKIKEIYDKVLINGLFLFTPFPNTPLANKLREMGYQPPPNLEEWGKILYGHVTNQPWFGKKYLDELITISDIVRFRYFNEFGFSSRLKSEFHILPYLIFNYLFLISARIRWKYKYFRFPIEWKVWSYIRIRYLEHT